MQRNINMHEQTSFHIKEAPKARVIASKTIEYNPRDTTTSNRSKPMDPHKTDPQTDITPTHAHAHRHDSRTHARTRTKRARTHTHHQHHAACTTTTPHHTFAHLPNTIVEHPWQVKPSLNAQMHDDRLLTWCIHTHTHTHSPIPAFANVQINACTPWFIKCVRCASYTPEFKGADRWAQPVNSRERKSNVRHVLTIAHAHTSQRGAWDCSRQPATRIPR